MENNSLTMLDKAGIAAMVALNASYRPREGREGKVMDVAIQTDKIRTLAEYREMNPEKFSTWNPERKDNNKLMRTYVIPIQLATGEEIDLIVNSKGQDMACVYRDEEGNENSFHLTSRMQKEILKDALGEEVTAQEFHDIKKVLIPETLEEFTKKVEKGNLVPEGKKDIEKRLADAGKNNEEKDDDGLTVEEAAAVTGLGEDVLSQFADENGKILGIRKTSDIENLSKQLDFELGLASSEVILLRVNDGGNKDRGYVLSPDGTILYSSMDGIGNTELVTDIVNTGSVGDDIDNIDKAIEDREAESKKIIYEDPSSGEKEIKYAEKGTVKEIEGYVMDVQVLLREMEEEITKLENNMDMRNSERLDQQGEIVFNSAKRMSDLQSAYGVLQPQMISEMENRGKYYKQKSEEERMKEGFLEVGGAAVGAVVGIVMGEKALTDRKKDSQENDGYGDTIGHYGKNLEDPFEKIRRP